MRTQVITLRTAISEDISAIDRLLEQSYPRLLRPDYPPSTLVTAVPLMVRANPALIAGGTYYVAESAEEGLLGVGGWRRRAPGGPVADVRHLATDWRHVRRGIARRIMMGIVSEARQAGVRRLVAMATRTAVPFYEAMGFDGAEAVLVSLRPGIDFPAVRLERTL